MKRLILASLCISIMSLMLSIFGFMQIHDKFMQIHDKVSEKVEVAGAIRIIDDTGWFIINDEHHTPINIDRVLVDNGIIYVLFSFKASTIHSFIVTPDETFAKAGFFVGASVNLNYAEIYVWKIVDGKMVPVDASTIRSESANFWIYGLFSKKNNILFASDIRF